MVDAFAQEPPGSWSAADVRRLLRVSQSVLSSLSPTEWRELADALTRDTPSQAQQVLQRIVGAKISEDDARWLAALLGSQASWDATDMRLLQQAFTQMRSGLTADEQELAASAWENWLRGLRATGSGSGAALGVTRVTE